MPFLNERLDDKFLNGSSWSFRHAAETVTTANGNEYRRLRHPYVEAMLEVDFTKLRQDMLAQVVQFNHKTNGVYRAFRVKNPIDFSTNSYVATPTFADQPMLKLTGGQYQVMRWYGDYNDAECARRRIRKPVSGSVLVGVNGALYSPSLYTLDETTGIVTFPANKQFSITGITKAVAAVITTSTHTFNVGESVHIYGVSGMTQINGKRVTILSKTTTTITVDLDTTGYSTYTSGGTAYTQPDNTREAVTAGCYFDIPMRFDADLSGVFAGGQVITCSGVGLVEVLNPDN